MYPSYGPGGPPSAGQPGPFPGAYGQSPGYAPPAYGQPPPQPGFGQQAPYGQLAVPGDPYAAQYGYGAPNQSPNGATAIIAAILALLGALAGLLSIVSAGVLLASGEARHYLSGFTAYLVISVVVRVVVVVLLGAGGIAMLMRRPVGRVLVVVGCGVTLLSAVVGLVISASVGFHAGLGGPAMLGGVVGLVLGAIPPIATMILALVPSTKHWLAAPR